MPRVVREDAPMIFITAKFLIKAEDADRWPRIAAAFTAATRAEPGCLWFDWSRSVDNPSWPCPAGAHDAAPPRRPVGGRRCGLGVRFGAGAGASPHHVMGALPGIAGDLRILISRA